MMELQRFKRTQGLNRSGGNLDVVQEFERGWEGRFLGNLQILVKV